MSRGEGYRRRTIRLKYEWEFGDMMIYATDREDSKWSGEKGGRKVGKDRIRGWGKKERGRPKKKGKFRAEKSGSLPE